MTFLQHSHIHREGRVSLNSGERVATREHGHKSGTRFSGVTIINLSSIMILILSLGVASAALDSLTPKHSSLTKGAYSKEDTASYLGPGSSDVIAIKEGANLDLNCSNAEQTEDMIISWTCNNKPASIKSNRIYVTESGRLRIQSAKVGDSCNYRCEAADGFGTWSVFIKVIVVDRQLMNKLTAGNQASSSSSSSSHENDPSSVRDKKRPPMKGDPTKFANKEIILNDSRQQQQQQHHLTSLGKLAAGGSLDGTASGGRDFRTASSNLSPHAGLSVQIEPEQVTVERNHSFSLNCKVNHSSHDKVPQIIWLKEFMGQAPSSLEHALQQNLIHLADGYYHTLNWPRSISYSRASFCANSALVIRHASFVHSGRYVCLSGYLDRLGVEPPPQRQNSFNDHNQENQFEPPGIPTSVQYVIAVTTVKVEEGSNGGDEEFYYRLRWRNYSLRELLIRIFGDEGSIWKLILCVLLLSTAIIITCFYKLRTKSFPALVDGGRKIRNSRGTSVETAGIGAKNSLNSQHVLLDASLVYPRDEQMKLNDSNHYNLMNRCDLINELGSFTLCQMSSATDEARAPSTDKTYAPEQHHTSYQQAAPQPELTRDHQFYGVADVEHVYSEIGVDLSKTVTLTANENHHSSSSCYKVPNKRARDY